MINIDKKYILLGALFLTLVFVLVLIATGSVGAPVAEDQSTIPTQSPIDGNLDQANTIPPVTYNTDASKKQIEKKENRIPLTQSDLDAKQEILSLLPEGQSYGIIYSSENFNIEYVESLDLIKVEILSNSIEDIKTEAVNWFRDQGLSQEGVCNYPVDFYLGSGVVPDGGEIFSPIAPGC